MTMLFAQLTVRWISVMTGAAHATSVLRSMARDVPDDDALPDDAIVVPRVAPKPPPQRAPGRHAPPALGTQGRDKPLSFSNAEAMAVPADGCVRP
ncbi:MAG: hypothetical protein IPG98_03170 [Burkholderiales bacterium]|nr:hypothetical protein [Burkholderiales bacterium]MBK8665677.1 hypothetical protein [Burkholderiales bacterium]